MPVQVKATRDGRGWGEVALVPAFPVMLSP
ncbi:hypothetical protein FBZ90_114120 [Nitrospirillum pindoramense]|uniref:Uncharacterized protein n=1 Tax=Nitrospirillum amazonense TaxID=28077 RepID=A0A560GV02_9PROT|nr:hypothetical protein FBZ90_114120 [Nitrospirillum amazonense]